MTTTTRMGVTRWSSDNDAFSRAQMDTSHAALESNAAGFLSGTLAARPTASAAYDRFFYLATDQGLLYYCNGTSWFTLNSYGTPGANTPGDTANAGVATTSARSDHRHSMPDWGVTGEVVAITTAASGGSAAKFARIDHTHAVADGAITAGKIAAGGVSATNQIADAIVTAQKMATNAIGKSQLAVDQQIPSGTVVAYVGLAAPTGWLFCDGTSYATASYAELFTAIQYRYGGAGANFNVPDFRTRVPRGATTPTSGATLGLTGGADSVTLASGNLPAHTHGVTSITVSTHAGHTHAVSLTSDATNLAHTHSINHDHASFTTAAGGSHTHTLSDNGLVFKSAFSLNPENTYMQFTSSLTSNDKNWQYDSDNDTEAATHTHSIDVPSFSGTSGSGLTTHTHGVSGNTGSDGSHTHTLGGTTDSVGSGTAIDITPKYQTINYIIKI